MRAAVCGFQGNAEHVNDEIEVEHFEQPEEVKNMLNQIVANSILFVGLLPTFRDELVKIFAPVTFLPGENATTQVRSYSCVPFLCCSVLLLLNDTKQPIRYYNMQPVLSS